MNLSMYLNMHVSVSGVSVPESVHVNGNFGVSVWTCVLGLTG